ncbi:hypothetical protein [Actinopolymorpha pittospori]|uniref:Uncharacterized protein n=1 Tax=Actinopolymorpha pittospori TaxID=648752 RepID=A0A927MNP6_9ACTN|nr:hypothetical protein [Actinopolymorpha pittospori]MBE1604055.1 hypothetical protein [Actinopolymorpha pittospori]
MRNPYFAFLNSREKKAGASAIDAHLFNYGLCRTVDGMLQPGDADGLDHMSGLFNGGDWSWPRPLPFLLVPSRGLPGRPGSV